MKFGATMMAAVLLSCSLAMAQVCVQSPGTACLVPAPSAVGTTTGTIATTLSPGIFSVVPVASLPASTTGYPIYVLTANGLVPLSSFQGVSGITTISALPTTSVSSICPSGVTSDAMISSQLTAIQGELRAARAQVLESMLEARGQSLIDRMNNLMAQEQMFRQQFAANPNLPNAQATAMMLQQQAMNLNSDIAAFQRQVNMTPADLRPYVAVGLNTFDVAYWTPATQRFIAYNTAFPQAIAVYQPLFAANPWLQTWTTTYQASLNNIATTPTVVASAGWVIQPQVQVLGSMEQFPTGSTFMMLPNGAAIYFPPGTMPMMSTTGMTTMPAGTVVTPTTVMPTTTTPTGTTTY